MMRFFSISFMLLTVFTVRAQQHTNTEEKLKVSNNNLNVAPVQNELSAPSEDVRSQGYYRTESDDFQQRVKEAPASAQAWLNLYKSSLYSFYNGTTKTLTAQQKEELNDIVSEMKQNVPGTFEYNIAVYINGQHNTTLLPYLIKAEEIKSNDRDVAEQFVAHYAITGNNSKCKDYVNKHRKIAGYEAFVEEYAYNLLKSVDENAVLFTHGIMDTYPLYYQQLSQKTGTGVEIINIDYLSSEEYRKNISKKLGIVLTYNGNNYTTAFDIAGKLKNSRSVYFSNAFSKAELKKHAAELELSGLAMKYGGSKTTGSSLDSKWQTFKVQHLQKADMKDDYSRKMSANYQPVLLTLHKYYNDAGKKKEAEEVKNIALKIAKVNGTEKQVAALLH